MAIIAEEKTRATIEKKYNQISFSLNEKNKRLWAASEAMSIGRGGIKIVHFATKLDYKTIRKGIKELKEKEKNDRIRKIGGGRKKIKYTDKDLLADLEKLIEPLTRGEPDSPLLWTSKSTYKLADELNEKGHQVSQKTIYNLLSELDYSLQSNRKIREGIDNPDRDKQFNHINEKVKSFQSNCNPVISVDTKKKENIGNFKNNGVEYQKKGKPIEVNIHDFPDKELGKVIPYGVYDVSENKGWVNVGISSDTAEFAVSTIRNWWYIMGKNKYSEAKELLITADCGGSNGYKVRLWKNELQRLANELQISISVCHFPPGTSKWNKIEHKMFSYITMNWRGKPLITKEAVVQLIANTKTKKGLEIKVVQDNNKYGKGKKISDAEFAKINIVKDQFHGEWNYTIRPQI